MVADNTDPGWKRNGRNGPFDWWLSCNQHGFAYAKGCMSCSMVEDHNIEFQQKLDRERNAGVGRLDGEVKRGQFPMLSGDSEDGGGVNG